MDYIYGNFSDKQALEVAHVLHNDIHKLLLYKDNRINDLIFEDDISFFTFFEKLLFMLGGMKTLLVDNGYMVLLMSTLQAAYNEAKSDNFHYHIFRKAILDAHGYIKLMLESEVDKNAEP